MIASTLVACSSDADRATVVSQVDPVPISAGFDRVTAPVLPQLESYTLGASAGSVFITGSRIDGAKGVNPAFVYDIGAHELRRVDPAPFSPAADAPQAVTVGNHVIVTGIACRDVGDRHADPPIRDCRPGTLVAARFDLVSHRWTLLPSPAPAVAGSVNAYLRTLGARRGVAVFQTPDRVVTFDDGTGQWSTIAMPGAPRYPVVCMLGDGHVLAYSSVPDPDVNLGGYVPAVGGTLSSLAPGASTWTPVDLPPVRFFDEVAARRANDFHVECGAHGFVLTDGQLDRVWYRDLATGTWRDIRPPGPSTTVGATPYDTVLTIGDRFFFSGPRAIAYDAATRTWSSFTPGAGRTFGQETLDVGQGAETGGAFYTLWANRPVPLALAAFRPRRTPLSTTG